MSDSPRDGQVNKLIAEAEASLGEARQSQEKLEGMIQNVGFGPSDDVLSLVRNGACSPDLQKLIDEDLAQLHKELMEEEAVLARSSVQAKAPKKRRGPPRRMTRI